MEQYKFVKQLGRGGFGCVWLVKSTLSGKQYVLKQIDLQHSSKRDQKAAFFEAKLLSTLHHSNIVSYLDSFYNSDGSLFIIMAYCERGDMYNYITKRNGEPFEEKQIIYWFVQLCLALKYLHDKNILHRDLKTKNLYLTRIKLIKIGDFGIARVLSTKNDMALTVIGTPTYMSPEVLCSKPYNYKSDIWGLGCCLYEMITLKQAFIAEDHPSLVAQVMNGEVPVISDIWNKELVNIVLAMLSQDPSDRPCADTILQNSCIKKNILMFLDESPTFFVNLGKKKQESAKVHTAQSLSKKTELTAETVKPNSNNGVEENPSRHSSALSQCNGTITLAVTVPDINGNGDGNDNSQHRSMPTRSRTFSYLSSRSATSYSMTSLKENVNSTKATNSIRSPKTMQRASTSIQLNQQKCAGVQGLHAKEEKRRGERSVEFLFSLTSSLKQARSASIPSNSSGLLTLPSVKQDFLLRNMRDYRKTHSSLSSTYANVRSKIFSPSAKSDSAILNDIKAVDRRMLESSFSNHIGFESNSRPGQVVLPEVSKILFPMRGSSADNELSEKITCDKNIDDNLLVEILGCKKTNAAARQRRREKLRANSLTESAPASVESLPVIVSREV